MDKMINTYEVVLFEVLLIRKFKPNPHWKELFKSIKVALRS